VVYNRRFSDQDGMWNKIRWVFCQPFATGIIGALIVILIAWVCGFLYTMPITYANKAELTTLKLKQDSDYKDLDMRKLNKEDYIREHNLLREEMSAGFNKLAMADERNLEWIMKIYTSQQQQYRKLNKQ
jgi:hypothetical protein